MNDKARETLGKASIWFNERPIRERVLITATGLVLLLYVVWELAVAPIVSDNQRLSSQLASLSQQQQGLAQQQSALSAQLASDPSQALREQSAARQARLGRLDQELADTTGQLIAPRAMVTLLRDILLAQDKLELVTVELLEPLPIYAESNGPADPDAEEGEESASESAAGPLLFAHEVELVVRGGYLDVLNYVETLEAMDERLGWVSLDYEMLEYPNNEIRIRVRTLSLEKAWLGV